MKLSQKLPRFDLLLATGGVNEVVQDEPSYFGALPANQGVVLDVKLITPLSVMAGCDGALKVAVSMPADPFLHCPSCFNFRNAST